MVEHSPDVQTAPDFDVEGLRRYLAEHAPGIRSELTIRKIEGGQSNPTYRLDDGNGAYILRRKPPGVLQPSAHAVDREYRVITALRDTAVPVPATLILCEDPDVIGTVFYIMDYVEGRIFHDQAMPGVVKQERRAIVEAMVSTLAALHRVDTDSVGLENFGRRGSYVARQIDRWSKIYRASATEHIPAMEKLLEWMPNHIPDSDATTIIHGDFRLGNLIVDPMEPGIAAVLDWELSTLGHPIADLAYNCLLYRLDERLSGFRNLDMGALGMPSESECVALYCRLTGRDTVPDWEFYLAFSCFRLAAISQGIMGRVRDHTASGRDAAERGARAPLLAQAAWDIVESGAP